MIDTDKYEDAKKMVQNAELIDENYGHPDIHYRKIAHLLAEVERLREAIADIATNMEAADASYMGGFIEDLWKVIE
tara:strand:- start:171 stop:398 length:228 start_codon:yes stop_codon:yes gene_type:complete